MSELLFSGSLGDTIMIKFAEKNGGVRVPERRLLLIFPAVIITAGKIPSTCF